MNAACSVLSASLGEALDGTAPEEGGFLVVEQPEPWERKAEKAVPQAAAAAGAAGLRLQVVRRNAGRYAAPRALAWVGSFGPERRFLERVWADELPALDLSRVAAGTPTGAGVIEPLPLFLICTHGTRDACCAKYGLPVHRAVWRSAPEGRTWHSSHLGGHRFAPTMAILPHGVWLGRVPAAEGRAVVAAIREQRLPIEYARGIAGRPAAVQAVELFVRRELGVDALDAVRVAIDGERARVEVDTPGGTRSLTAGFRLEPAGERPLSCGPDAKVEDPGRWVVEIY